MGSSPTLNLAGDIKAGQSSNGCSRMAATAYFKTNSDPVQQKSNKAKINMEALQFKIQHRPAATCKWYFLVILWTDFRATYSNFRKGTFAVVAKKVTIIFKQMGCCLQLVHFMLWEYIHLPVGCFNYLQFLFTKFCLSAVLLTNNFMRTYKFMHMSWEWSTLVRICKMYNLIDFKNGFDNGQFITLHSDGYSYCDTAKHLPVL